MHSKALLSALAGLTLVHAQAQGPAPPASTLSTTFSGVLPVLPTATPFTGVETEEGAITNDGPSNPGITGLLGNATVQNGNPLTTYQAVLPSFNFDPDTGSLITGTISGAASANGTGVMFTVNFTGFPSESQYGPFVYHIHQLPVGPDGNCTATLGHLDPTNRGEYYPCDVTQPQTCQAGDLAGKHGNITSTSWIASYTDLYLSTTPGSPYFFGDKSIVIHSSNTTRLTCANFSLMASGAGSASPTGTGMGSAPSGTAAPGFTGGAGRLTAGLGMALVGMVAAFVL